MHYGRSWSNSGSCSRRRGPTRSRFRRGFFRGAFGFRSAFGVRYALQVLLNFFRDIGGNRTGVRLLFLDSKTRQKVNDSFRLDLDFARELIDADLICVAHAS
jgi:hypothetical protein